MVIDEAEEIRLAPGDGRPVQGVAGPQVTRRRGLETTVCLRSRSVGAGVQPEAGEVPLDRAF